MKTFRLDPAGEGPQFFDTRAALVARIFELWPSAVGDTHGRVWRSREAFDQDSRDDVVAHATWSDDGEGDDLLP